MNYHDEILQNVTFCVDRREKDMKKERTTNPEENKKKHKKTLVFLLVLLLAVIGVTVGAVVMTASNPGESDGRLYYNVDYLQYIGGDGLSIRELGEDGYYKVLLAVDGEQIEYKVKDKAILDKIDGRDLMGLSIDRKDVITDVFEPEEVTGGEVVNKWFVTAVDSTSVTVSDTGNEDGLSYTLQLTENTGIYDITRIVEPIGKNTTLKQGDCIRAFKDVESGIRYIFVVVADESAFRGSTHEKYCEHCKQEVTWYEWDETNTLPTSAGHWCIMNDIQLERRQVLKETMLNVFDLNGKTVDGARDQRILSVNHAGATLVILDQSANKDGTLRTHGNTQNGGIVFVEKGNFELYSGILDASDVDCDYQGVAVRTAKNTTSTMYGGTIIGGTTNCVFLGSGNKSGGAGGALFVGSHSSFTMKNGTIRDGVVNTYTYEDESRTFGCGGNIYCQAYATFTMEGGTISGGKSGNWGGNVYCEKKAVVTITGGEIKDGYSAYDGGNVMAYNGATLTIEGITISNGVAEKGNGGNVHVANKATLDMSNVTLLSGKAFRGGNLSVFKEAKKATVKNVVMKNGVAIKEGGNLVLWGKSTLNMSDSKLLNGKAGYRGGNIQSFGDLNMTSCTVSDGKVTTWKNEKNKIEKGIGGNIHAAAYAETKNGVTSFSNGKVQLSGVTVSGGVSEQSSGGNIYIKDKGKLVLINNTVIENGKAVNGGNVYITSKSTMSMANGIIQKGDASNQGGNVVVWGRATFNFTGGTITKGEAVIRGGNIVALGNINMTGGIISDGTATSDKGDNSNGIGGNIYCAVYIATEKDAAGNEVKVPYRSVIKIKGGTVTGGKSLYSRGGNIYLGDRADLIVSGQSVIDKGVAKKNGGNLFAQKESKITLNTGVIVKDGIAGGDAGNIQIGENGVLTVNNAMVINGTSKQGGNICTSGTVTIQGKKATVKNGIAKKGGNIYVYAAGVINVKDGTITFDDDVEQETTNGGNIYSLGQLAIQGGLITKGISSESGGNIYSIGKVAIDGGLIEKGISGGNGGNIFHENENEETTFTMKKGSVIGGSGERGGNIYLASDTTGEISNATITDGVAELEGGNIASWSRNHLTIAGNTVISRGIGPNRGANISSLGSVTLKGNCVIGDETVVAESKIGGNIYVASYVDGSTDEVVQSTFVMEGGTIQNGTVAGDGDGDGYGGNIYVKDYVAFVLNGGTIKNGQSVKDGGNVYTDKTCTIAINGGTITTGTASGVGGNVYYGNYSDEVAMTMTAGSIIAGSAKRGGNLYMVGRVTLTAPDGTPYESNGAVFQMSGGSITDGVATATDGGNIAVWSKGHLTVSGNAVISRGTAPNRGGDICALGSVIIKDNAVIGDVTVESTAKTGGNIYLASYLKDGVLNAKSTLTMQGGTIQNGSASTSGGCVHAQDYADIVMTNNALITSGRAHTGTSNTAGIGGNIYIKQGVLDVTASTIGDGTSEASRAGNVYVQQSDAYLRTGAVISGGTAKHNAGNIMTNASGCEIHILGGTVTGGTSQGGEGGNIRLGSDTVLIFDGGSVTNGASAKDGGNIFADSAVKIRFEGGLVTISGGLKGTTTSNLYMNAPNDARHVTVINDLTEGSSIGITVSRNGYFTDKDIADQKNHVGYFVPDVTTKKVIYGPDAGYKQLGLRYQDK